MTSEAIEPDDVLTPQEAKRVPHVATGRPRGPLPDFDQAKAQTILDYLTAGAPIETAAAAAGVKANTFRTWLRRAARLRAKYPDQEPELLAFAEAVPQAMAQARVNAIVMIQNADAWQSKAWFLERTDPEHFGRKDTVDVHITLEGIVARLAKEHGVDEQALLEKTKAIYKQLGPGSGR